MAERVQWLVKGSLAILHQFALSGSNLAAHFLVAFTCEKDVYAVYAIGSAALLVAQSIHVAFVTDRCMVLLAKWDEVTLGNGLTYKYGLQLQREPDKRALPICCNALRMHLIVVSLLAVFFTVVFLYNGFGLNVLVCLLIAMAGSLTFFLLRSVCTARLDLKAIAIGGCAYGISQIIALMILYRVKSLDAATSLCSIGIAACIALPVMLRCSGSIRLVEAEGLREYSHYGWGAAITGLLNLVPSQAYIWAWSDSNLPAVAEYRFHFSLLLPFTQVAQALSGVSTSHLTRMKRGSFDNALFAWWSLYFLLASGYSVLLLVAGTHTILSHKYALRLETLIPLCSCIVFSSFTLTFSAAFRSFGRSWLALPQCLVAAGITIVLGLPDSTVRGTLGALDGLESAYIMTVAVGFFAFVSGRNRYVRGLDK